MKITRRQFLKGALATGIGLALPLKFGVRSAHAAANSPALEKWIQPMRGLGTTGIPIMAGTNPDPYFGAGTTYYQVTVGEFTDVLHPNMGGVGVGAPTRLWGYWDTTNPVKRHLAGVIIANRHSPVRIRFTNTLPTPHIIPVDTTVPGANQAQNRTATHLHGGFVPWTSDGGPFDWWTPSGVGGLSFLNGPGGFLDNLYAAPNKMVPGQADYYYPNNQSTRLVWYHDHAHGITRINAYGGIATGYLLVDPAQEAALATKVPSLANTIPLVFQDKVFVDSTTIGTTDPTWATVARADVQSTGSLWYAHIYDPAVFRLLSSPRYLTPPNPSAIAEFFGDTMLCNGTVYPLLTVEPKAYRFMILNACNARFLNINLVEANTLNPDGIDLDPNTLFPTNPAGPNMYQIANEGGYLVSEVIYTGKKPFNPATLQGQLILGNAERADVIIDFTNSANKEFIMYNDSPGPFPGGDPAVDYFLGNPATPQATAGKGPDTRQILRIKVGATATAPIDPRPVTPILIGTGVGPDPALLAAIINTTPPIAPLVPSVPVARVRNLTLNEDFDQYGRLRQLMGTTSPGLVGKGFGLEYLASPTEVVNKNDVEVWRIFNISGDTHPIHFHLVNVQILSRQPFKVITGRFIPVGAARGPEPDELGWKETVKMHPGEVISVIMKFELPAVPFVVPSSPRATMALGNMGMGLPVGPTYNEYVVHCHILEHEEHDMMRPLVVIG